MNNNDKKPNILNAMKQLQNNNNKVEETKKVVLPINEIKEEVVEPKLVQEEVKEPVQEKIEEVVEVKDDSTIEEVVEEVVEEVQETKKNKKRIINMPIYVSNTIYNDFIALSKELNISNPKFALLLEKEYFNLYGKENIVVEDEETLDSLIKKSKIYKGETYIEDEPKHVIQIYVPNEIARDMIINNRNSLGFKTTTDYFKVILNKMLPIVKERISKED